MALEPINSLEEALDRCKTLGMRVSRQRRFILELLWQDPGHLSAREIYNRLNQRGKEIGHTSVYQNLEVLARNNIVECVDRAEGRLYGNITTPHSHINCLNTGEIVDISVDLPPELVQAVEQQTGMKVTEYRINFYGYPAATDAVMVNQPQESRA